MLEKEGFYNLRNRNVKRILWPVNHEQSKQDLKKEQHELKKELTQKYNFDFENEKPLRGRYLWVAVTPESPVGSPLIMNDEESCAKSKSREFVTRSEKKKQGIKQKRPGSFKKTLENRKKPKKNTSVTSQTTYSLRRVLRKR